MTSEQLTQAQTLYKERVGENQTKNKKGDALLFVCNNAKFYEKAKNQRPKEGVKKVVASASVTILMDSKKAELLLGSKTNSLINTRTNSDLDLIIEKEGDEYLFTGVEDAENPESDYFTYYTEKEKLIASYSDIVVFFDECIDLGAHVEK